MKIGILITGHAPDALIGETGNYDKIFARLLDGHGHDFDYAAYAVVDNEFPDSAKDCDGWLLTGSKHGAYEDHDWIPPLEDLIRDIHARGIPMIGVCFGHQIIAQALGGKVEKFSGGWVVGPTEYDYGDRQVVINAWHQDQVTELPEGAQVLGSNAMCKNAMLAYGDRILDGSSPPRVQQPLCRRADQGARSRIGPRPPFGRRRRASGHPHRQPADRARDGPFLC